MRRDSSDWGLVMEFVCGSAKGVSFLLAIIGLCWIIWGSDLRRVLIRINGFRFG
jgi:hypothetical protein